MKTTVNASDFVNAFQKIRPDQFSRDGLRALFSYLEEMENDLGAEMEMDVVGLCCEYSEYKSAVEAASCYDWESDDENDDDDADRDEKSALEYLQDRTQVIIHDGGVIVASF